jgi:uncharacterized SAM-binding protein YcdF (DUF218 family)
MFILSKLAGLFLLPSNVLVFALCGGLGLSLVRRTARFGRRLALGAGVGLLAVVLLPVGDGLLASLERRFPPLEACRTGPVAGVILLGGGLAARTRTGEVIEDLNEGADRLRYAAALARRYPDVPVIIAGGQVYERSGARSEAEGMADVLAEFGVSRDRLRLETRSRTTAENAAYVAPLASEAGAWLLVTSGWHMPRSVAAFRKMELDVIAAPTDWKLDDQAPALQFSASGRLGVLDLAVREYLGLVGYQFMSRSRELFPKPDSRCA